MAARRRAVRLACDSRQGDEWTCRCALDSEGPRTLGDGWASVSSAAEQGEPGRSIHRAPSDLTVFLHIGIPKSGTTYLQARIGNNARRAREQGLLWPGPGWRPHVEAARDLRGLSPGGQLDPAGPWMSMAREIGQWSGPAALLSMEWLSACTHEQAEVAVGSLHPARVEVIVTARDLLRSFVAQWQEMTKNYRTWGWDQFVAEMLGESGGPASEVFWLQQDVAAILRTWSGVVSPDRMHVVTVPPHTSDPEILWRRFTSLVGLDGTAFPPLAARNESLGMVSAVLMQRVNAAALSLGVPQDVYQRVLHKRLANRVLAGYRAREPAISVSSAVDAWIRGRAERLVSQIHELDVDVVGDLDDLLPGAALIGMDPADVADADLLSTCVDALVALAIAQDNELAAARYRGVIPHRGGAAGKGQQPQAGDGRRPRPAARLRRAVSRARAVAAGAVAAWTRR